MREAIRIVDEVREALTEGRPVVALETSVVAHGLPSPANLAAARRCAAAVRGAGAVPAVIGVIEGRICVGLSEGELERLADPGVRAAKVQARDLAATVVEGRDGGTTVSATVAVSALVGIRTMATGGIGGVHRLAPGETPAAAGDVSADLDELSRQPVCVVSSGPKAILDLPATAEALETLGIPTVGFQTSEMPAFFTDDSVVALEHRVEDARAAAALLHLHWGALRRREGVLLFVPPPAPLPRAAVEEAVQAGLHAARARGVIGKAVTPFLLEAVAIATGGRSRDANLGLLEHNATVAGHVAVALALASPGSRE